MKKTGTPHAKFIAAAAAFTWMIVIANSAGAAQLQEARVTQVVNDVKLLLEQAAPRPAAVSDLIRHGTAVRTGTQSRSELTFADLTITRLGANTIFSFKEGTREMNLIDGAILFQVPKGSGGATIRTVGVTAAITGTTGIAEFHPATKSHPQLSKWLCLEGTFHLYLPNGQSVEVGPGKMVASDGKSFSKVATFDIAKLVSTSLFFTGFDTTLASMNLIMLASESQLASLAITTTNPLDPARIVNVTSLAVVAEETPTPPPASPTPPITPTPPPPTPTKFGTPSVISSPAPYLITTGTVITTDPSIATNGVTDFGKIYRGQTDDGPFSLWAFGSTSAFDTALRIDNIFFSDPSHLPIAAFKFESLSLTGDPTINTTNGVIKLALIGVDGITSGPPGGTLTFTGLDLVILATVNGSINLTSGVSFQDLHELVMYARGAGSDLTINSPISNIQILGLVAEDSIHLTNPGAMSVGKLDAISGGDLILQIGGSLLLNGRVRLDAIVLPGAGVDSGVNLTLNVEGNYTNNSATEFSHLAITNRDNIGGDASIAVGATNISTANNFDVDITNPNRQIGGNALINVAASNGINIAGDATFQIQNSDGGHIGGDANISVGTSEDLTANSINALVNNRNGGTIASGAALSFDIGGNLTTQGDASFGITNRNDGGGGGVINGDVTIDLTAANVSIGGGLLTDISTNRGGHIASAFNHVGVGSSLMAQGYLDFEIENAGFLLNDTFLPGGTIDSDAILDVRAGNISTATDYFNALISNDGGGHIGGNAIINVVATGGINAATDAFFTITNNQNDQGPPAGTIGGDAAINVTAANVSTGGRLFAVIDNSGGGTIGGSADLAFGLTGDVTSQGDATFTINNSDGGTIGGDAIISVNADNISTGGSFSAGIESDNVTGGHITNGASVNLTLGGNLTTASAGNLQLFIDNQPGTIGTNANIFASIGGNVTAGQFTDVTIFNTEGSIGGNADITTNFMGDLTAGDAAFGIYNFGGGSIGSNAGVTVNIGGNLSSAGDAAFFIWNYGLAQGSGSIGQNAFIDVSLSGDLNAQGTADFEIINSNNGASATIGGDATINVSAANITANSLVAQIDNTGGSIGTSTEGGATINMNVSGNATVTNNATLAIYGSDGAVGGAQININGGNYNVGGTFLSSIDGNGTMTFNNASAHAEVLKAGVFGANGVLNIGGGTLSADTTLKLYAPGSNGQLNFVSNVTLGGNSVKILAANSITIFDNVVVTIGGSRPANVYTGFTGEIPNANYTGFGGNGSRTGTFAGAGANRPRPIGTAPPFGTPNHVTSSGRHGGASATHPTINIRSSDELLALLDGVHPGRDGQIRIPDSRGGSHERNSSRLNAAAYLNAHRQAMDTRTASTLATRRLPQ